MNEKSVQLDFIGVGAAKSGTSWLSACLGQHPDICMAEPKELNYFCERAIWHRYGVNRDLGPRWLAARFADCRPGQLRGEFSPNYLCDERSPELIFAHNKRCRLIFLFRDPVEVVVSLYHQIRKESPVSDSFERFISQYPEIQDVGLYYRHVQRFLSLFPKEQCLFLFFDDLQRDPAAVLQSSFRFLSVPADFMPGALTQRINESQTARSRGLLRATDLLRRLVPQNQFVRRSLWTLKLPRLHEWILHKNLEPFAPPPIAQETRQFLDKFYRADTIALGELLGRDLSGWQASALSMSN